MIGDHRWTGAFGVNLDLIARSHCSVELIKTADIVVRFCVFTFQAVIAGCLLLCLL